MIISHRHKFAYFRVPKTGSSTVETVLRMSGAFDSNDTCTEHVAIGLPNHNIPDALAKKLAGTGLLAHMTPASAIEYGLITEQQLLEYTCVATIRKPASRWRSILGHLGLRSPADSIKILESKAPLGEAVLEIPQSDYFIYKNQLVCEPLWFDQLDDEIKKLISKLGANPLDDVPKLNENKHKDNNIPLSEFIPERLRPKFKARFKEDLKLYKRLLEHRETLNKQDNG